MSAIELCAGADWRGLGVRLVEFTPFDVVEWDRRRCDPIRENLARCAERVGHWPAQREGNNRGRPFEHLASRRLHRDRTLIGPSGLAVLIAELGLAAGPLVCTVVISGNRFAPVSLPSNGAGLAGLLKFVQVKRHVRRSAS